VSGLRSLVLVSLLSILLAACGGPPRVLVVSAARPEDTAGTVRIFVATSRASTRQPEYFSGERSPAVGFARLDISVPRSHQIGQLELPGSVTSAGDPASHFTVSGVERLTEPEILKQVRAEIAQRPQADREVLVFVHGFNTNFADAAFRFAQIVTDSGFKGVPVLFTWPSRAQVLAYPYDRDSADFSRDALEIGLRAIARDLGANRFDILAHSMGTLLTVETLRQAAIRGDGSFGGKLRNVMLAAPDIDIDVFKTQLAAIKRPVTVFVSSDDRALDFSRQFAGDKARLGAISEKDTDVVADLSRAGARIIDLSKDRSGDDYNHGKFATTPRIVQMIGRRLGADGLDGGGGSGMLGLDAKASPSFAARDK
jgi:esterase/lipase superfamily enzyme